MAMYRLALGFKGRTSLSSGLSTDGSLISASVVPHCGVGIVRFDCKVSITSIFCGSGSSSWRFDQAQNREITPLPQTPTSNPHLEPIPHTHTSNPYLKPLPQTRKPRRTKLMTICNNLTDVCFTFCLPDMA